jgi:hypothetical protein
MTTNETLKEICNMIWYTPKFEYQEYDWLYSGFTWYWEYYKWYDMTRMVDVREIIFDPVFMEKLRNHLRKWNEYWYYESWENLLLKNLHDPTSYLANLLGLWQK